MLHTKILGGMKFAHEILDILDRLLEEKHSFNELRTSDDKLRPYAIVIPEKPFEVLMLGWAKQLLSQPSPLPHTNARGS